MFQLANSMMNVVTNSPKLADEGNTGSEGKWEWNWVADIVDAINWLLYPLLILVGTAGVIYAVYLGVNLARADSADKQQEAKKRMINAIIGLASIIALILLLKLFCNSILPMWLNPDTTIPV
ncbi:MAG: hypothetical protein J6C13_03895 [Clostridia bacterium]|nr:hypothetical protein [Clostridia bacterium]